MNKSDLITAIAQTSGLTKADATRALNATTSAITSALSTGDSVAITGFGSFLVRDRAARTGRNPQTGAAIQIKASKVPAFKAGKLLKESVNA
jgi:DNA-binding protein HU-beta